LISANFWDVGEPAGDGVAVWTRTSDLLLVSNNHMTPAGYDVLSLSVADQPVRRVRALRRVLPISFNYCQGSPAISPACCNGPQPAGTSSLRSTITADFHLPGFTGESRNGLTSLRQSGTNLRKGKPRFRLSVLGMFPEPSTGLVKLPVSALPSILARLLRLAGGES
jgi:hypothetical protein